MNIKAFSSKKGAEGQVYKFSEKAVAFIDILGFERLIELAEQLDNPGELIQFLDKALAEEFSKSYIDRDQFKLKLFSDCISISTEPLPQNILMLIRITASIQRNLAQKGITLRGGIAVGKHFENENMIFSKALVVAHLLEKKFAYYPRVLIFSKILDYVPDEQLTADKSKYGTTFIGTDSDGYLFVDYLDNIRHVLETTSDSNVQAVCIMVLQMHRECIQQYTEEIKTKSEIGKKYSWMATYHNRKVSDCPVDPAIKQGLIINDLPVNSH